MPGVDHHQRAIRFPFRMRQRCAPRRGNGGRNPVARDALRAEAERLEAQRPLIDRRGEMARIGRREDQRQCAPLILEPAARHQHRTIEIEHHSRPVAATPALPDRADHALARQRRAGTRAVDIDRDAARAIEDEARCLLHRGIEMDQHAAAVDLDALDGGGLRRGRERDGHEQCGHASPPPYRSGPPPRHRETALYPLHAPYRDAFPRWPEVG